MKKIIRLTESELVKMIGKVINEQANVAPYYNFRTGQMAGNPQQQKRIANIGAAYASVKNGIITQGGSQNGKKWVDYITDYNVNSADLAAAKELNKKNQEAQQTQNTRMQNIVSVINQIDPETAKIKSNRAATNGISFDEYMKKYNVSQDDIRQAKAYVASLAKTQPEQAQKATEVLSQVSKTPPPAGKTPPAGVVKPKSVKPDPKVMELQKQLVAAGYKLGTSGPNRDGVDGIMGPRTRQAQQMVQQKGQQSLQSISQEGKNLNNQFNKTILQNSTLTAQQQANAEALKAGQPLPQTKAPVAPAVTDQAPTEPGQFGEIKDGWQWNDKQQKWNKLQ
jgi:uncharacterized protein (DUF433 family)